MYGPPVDLSFKNVNCLEGAMSELPRTGLRPLNMNTNKKYLSRSLRLCNNKISDLVGLHNILSHFLAQPSKLGWLDLSFNNLRCIDPVLCELRELRVLYLHANRIWDLSAVNKLVQLQHLHTITLHGNAIENNKGYRSHVICALPQLKRMDFSVVTHQERVMTNVWCRPSTSYGKNSKERKPDD